MTFLDPVLKLLTPSLPVMRRRVLGSRLANDESTIVTARAQIGLTFFLLFCSVLFLVVCLFVFFIVVVFHIQDPLNVYVQIFAPCRAPYSGILHILACGMFCCTL